MKKAKFFLSALTVLAVVGGALAFKVTTSHDYFTCNIPEGKCNIFFTNTMETTADGVAPRDFDVLDAPCDATHPCHTLVTADL